jgi:peptidoglycan/LPS O-acetylase OafA/YrhL
MESAPSVTSAAKAEPKLRLHSIDILRGVAAISVAFYHIWGHDGGYAFPSIGIVPQSQHITFFTYLVSPFRWGYLGVSLFLVLSGFCIHLPYARKKYAKGSYEFKGRPFFARRIWRLYPAYFVAVMVTALVVKAASLFPQLHTASHLPIPTLWDVISHLTMLHGFFEEQFYSIASVFWSLSLEFQLYLAYPLFLLAFRKFGVGKSVIGIILLSLIWRYVAIYFFHGNLISVSADGPFISMGCLPARMAEWISGAFLAELFSKHVAMHRNDRIFSGKRLLFISASILLFSIAIATTFSEPAWIVTDPLFGLSFASLIAAVILPNIGALSNESPKFIARIFIQIGIISYSLYLIHSQFGWIVTIFVPAIEGYALGFVLRIVFLAISFVPIYYFFRWFERPFLSPPKEGSRLYHFYRKLEGTGVSRSR